MVANKVLAIGATMLFDKSGFVDSGFLVDGVMMKSPIVSEPMAIRVRKIGGKKFSYNVKPEDTIKDVKAMIRSEQGIDPKTELHLFESRRLLLEGTLSSPFYAVGGSDGMIRKEESIDKNTDLILVVGSLGDDGRPSFGEMQASLTGYNKKQVAAMEKKVDEGGVLTPDELETLQNLQGGNAKEALKKSVDEVLKKNKALRKQVPFWHKVFLGVMFFLGSFFLGFITWKCSKVGNPAVVGEAARDGETEPLAPEASYTTALTNGLANEKYAGDTPGTAPKILQDV